MNDSKVSNTEVKKLLSEYTDNRSVQQKLDNALYLINETKKILEERSVNTTLLDEELSKITNELNELDTKINSITDRISNIRKECDHDWEEYAHDSHYTYYRCTKCGHTERN